MQKFGAVLGGLVTLALATAYVPAQAAPQRPALASQSEGGHAERAAASVRTVDPVSLKRGPDAAIDYLQNRVVHTATGTRIKVPFRYGEGQVALLGRTPKGWMVAWGPKFDFDIGYRYTMSLVRPGRRPVTLRGLSNGLVPEDGGSLGWRLDRDGSTLAITKFDRDAAEVTARDVATGKKLGHQDVVTYFLPFDVADSRVLYQGEDDYTMMDWAPRSGINENTGAQGIFADLRRDLVFAVDTHRMAGPQSLSDPNAPVPWAAQFWPMDVSPDGTRVLGFDRNTSGAGHALEVRAMSDGTVLDEVSFGTHLQGARTDPLGPRYEQTVRFETDDTFIVQVSMPRGATLVRCKIDGACERASDVGTNITTPYESFIWP